MTPNREKIEGTWNRIKQAGISLAPIPLGAQAFTGQRNYPGQGQRQLAASAGIKLEPARTAVSETMQRAQAYLKSIGKAPQIEITHIAGTGFGDLRSALVRQDDSTAMQEIDKLRATGMDDAKIEKHFADYAKRAYSGSAAREKDFLATLTPDQTQVYQDSLKEKQDLLGKVQGLLKAHPPAGKQTPVQKFRSKVKGRKGGRRRKKKTV
jgi:hypothetical protein